MTELTISAEDLGSFHEKTVIVTGASSGIGLATSQLFSTLGAKVVMADLSAPKEPVPNSVYVQTDVTKWASLATLFKEAGRVDVVCVNAGISSIESFFEPAEGEELQEAPYPVLDVNLTGALNSMRLAVHHMRKHGGGGSIITTTSLAAYAPTTFCPVYNAGKAAITHLIRSLKMRLSKDNISISSVAPAMTNTSIMAEALLEGWEAAGNMPQPASAVANAIVYCAAKGAEANGWGITVAYGKYVEFEEAIQKDMGGLFGSWDRNSGVTKKEGQYLLLES